MTEEVDKKAFSLRLKKRMKELDIKGADITRAIGISSAGITKWNKGEAAPEQYLLPLAKFLQCDPQWLLHGTGSASKSNPNSEIGELHPYQLWSSNDPLSEEDYAFLPFFKDIEFQGGIGRTEMQDYNGYRLPFAKSSLYRSGVPSDQAFCVTLTGNSMEPLIPRGATIGINMADKNIKDGDIYAIRQDDLIRVKRLYRATGGKIRINSYNEAEYEDELADAAEVEIIGRVFTWSVMV